jgi:hypothetical protein
MAGKPRVEFEGAFYHVIVRGSAPEDLSRRAQLAYLSPAWCGMKATEIARRLKRDPSMVSRQCASYEAARDLRTERKLLKLLEQVTTQTPTPHPPALTCNF